MLSHLPAGVAAPADKVVGSGQVQPLPGGGPALGIATAATYEEQSVDLGAGQTLVVYSDGVTDALNENDAFFGDERLLGSLRETTGRAAAEVAHRLLGALEAFVGEARWHDDVSLVVVRRAGRESDGGAEAGWRPPRWPVSRRTVD